MRHYKLGRKYAHAKYYRSLQKNDHNSHLYIHKHLSDPISIKEKGFDLTDLSPIGNFAALALLLGNLCPRISVLSLTQGPFNRLVIRQ